LQPIPRRADDAAVHPAVAALSLEEKGLVLGAALARTPPAALEARLTGATGARCAAAIAALSDETRPARAAAIAALTALVREPVPAGIERIHPDWLRERLEREPSAIVRTVAAGLPAAVRDVAASVLRARGDDPRLPDHRGDADAPGATALQRVTFAGLVPLAGPGAPATPIARELAALAPEALERAIATRGAEALGRSLRGAPASVVARAAASVGEALAPVLLEAARDDGDGAMRDRARETVAAAGIAASGEAALAIGVHALAALLADEGDSAVLAVAQRLPMALGRRLLAATDQVANGVEE
jgi:hypothetical protein